MINIINKVLLISLIFFVSSCTNNLTKLYKNKEYTKNNLQQLQNSNDSKSVKRKRKLTSTDIKYSNPNQKNANYQKAVDVINNGNRVEGVNILQSLVNNFPNYTPATNLLNRLESPFSSASFRVEKYINDWVSAPSEIPAFSLDEPPLPTIPATPILSKKEFETSEQFNVRINLAKSNHNKELGVIKDQYVKDVKSYNASVDDYNNQLIWESKSRKEKIPSMRKRYLNTAFNEILGSPTLASLKYDADNETFYGHIISSGNNLDLNVKIPVILPEARMFKQNISSIKPIIKIDVIDGYVVFSSVTFPNNGKIYPGVVLDSEKVLPQVRTITTGTKSIDFTTHVANTPKTLSIKDIVNDNNKFFAPKK